MRDVRSKFVDDVHGAVVLSTGAVAGAAAGAAGGGASGAAQAVAKAANVAQPAAAAARQRPNRREEVFADEFECSVVIDRCVN
jgi:hypothetical protein